ncbi:hypothetical protein Pogu_1944 [Pyrobaculum oguniense TE7]|uniref:Uncharacterized protein n=1 Tax=Pyrobaculum oguniense (strain DSM 13380 / JCM 10595 / TE7) TaxID=698757 RepID=H6QCK3_PYROT|nr:hypothetical protein Pogu_1944 [Pyrobaculum oguniense TE7]
MVEAVEAKIEEFESAEACFTSVTFGDVCVKVSPLKAKVPRARQAVCKEAEPRSAHLRGR